MEENGLGPTSDTFASMNLGNDFVIWVTKKLHFYIYLGITLKEPEIVDGKKKKKRFRLCKEANFSILRLWTV